jgi:hypothetical protein
MHFPYFGGSLGNGISAVRSSSSFSWLSTRKQAENFAMQMPNFARRLRYDGATTKASAEQQSRALHNLAGSKKCSSGQNFA